MRGYRRTGRIRADRERRYALLCAPAFFGIRQPDGSQAFVAGANSAAPDEKCNELDAAGGTDRHSASWNLLSPYCPGWTTDPRTTSSKKSVQPTSSLLLIFSLYLYCPSFATNECCLSSCGTRVCLRVHCENWPSRTLRVNFVRMPDYDSGFIS